MTSVVVLTAQELLDLFEERFAVERLLGDGTVSGVGDHLVVVGLVVSEGVFIVLFLVFIVVHVLEAFEIRGHRRVALDDLIDGFLVAVQLCVERRGGSITTDDLRQAFDERRGGLGRGQLRGVGRNGGLQRGCRQLGAMRRVVENSDDSGGTLVATALQIVRVDHLLVDGGAENLRRLAVGNVGQERAE